MLVDAVCVVIVAHIVGVTRHNTAVRILGQHREHLLIVRRLAEVLDRNMHTEDKQLVLWYVFQIVTQPLDLLIGKIAVIFLKVGDIVIDDVVHRHDMRIASIPRVVNRAESRFEHTLHTYRGVRIASIERNRLVVAVVVTDGLEHRHTDLLCHHLVLDHRHQIVGIARTLRIDNIAERNGIARIFALLGRTLQIGSSLRTETIYVAQILTLRIGNADKMKILLHTTLQRTKHEIVTLVVGQFLVEARVTLTQRHLILGRNRIIDIRRLRMAVEAIGTLRIGHDNGISVRNHHVFNRHTIDGRNHARHIKCGRIRLRCGNTRHERSRQQQHKKSFHFMNLLSWLYFSSCKLFVQK